eukprot:3221365-Rhodomonas_salina.3
MESRLPAFCYIAAQLGHVGVLERLIAARCNVDQAMKVRVSDLVCPGRAGPLRAILPSSGCPVIMC